MTASTAAPSLADPMRAAGAMAPAGWWLRTLALGVALAILLPIAAVAWQATQVDGGRAAALGADAEAGSTWAHLVSTVLPDYVVTTAILCVLVAFGVVMLGVGAAWVVTRLEFPGRATFEWAMVLPLAMPAYVAAYVYTDLLQFVGPVQTSLREWFGWRRGDYWFPDVRSTAGAAAMFAFVLYPYVYLLARTAFLERAGTLIEAARMLGQGPWRAFRRVSLPLARPAIAAGVALALMETLADFGTVAYFGVQTFTTGIYRAWFTLGDRAAASQLALLLLGFVAVVLAFERISRGHARYDERGSRRAPVSRTRLAGPQALAAIAACALPLLLGFLLPAGLLLRMALGEGEAHGGARFFRLAGNSLLLAGSTAIVAVGCALVVAYAARLERGWVARASHRVAGLGYALPGTVIAVGVLIPVTRLDHAMAAAIEAAGFGRPGLLLTGSIAALVYACVVRYLTAALQAVDSGLARITPNMDAAARSLGHSPAQTLRRIHLPLLRGSLLTALLLVFIDVMKELPATLVMRPFNFDTLATQAYTLASDERLAEAALPALAIVAVGLLPLVILCRQIARGEATSAS